MHKVSALLLVAIISGGCAGYGEKGNFAWCNDRYLQDNNRFKKEVANNLHKDFAKRGYLYALAGALVLQSADDVPYHFKPPSRLEPIIDPPSGPYGFDVKSFKLLDASSGNVKEIIIAFVGSNDPYDWLCCNFGFSQEQHSLARDYVKKIAKAYPDNRIVVTGYSLGGALATHVAKHGDTRQYISEAWAFNPSPKTWVSEETDMRIWVGSARGEALSWVRSPYFSWFPGIRRLGAPPQQTAEDFYLIKTNWIYGHFRWVLARNMLHFADLAMAPDISSPITEPLEILRSSTFEACKAQEISKLSTQQ